MNKQFKIFTFFIVLMSILTVNYPRIVSPHSGSSSMNIFLVSIFLVIFFHLNLYKLYNLLLNLKIYQTVTRGLFYSSIVGSIIISLFSLYIFLYVRSSIYDFHFGEELMMLGLYTLITIYVISIIIAFLVDSSVLKKNVSKFMIFLAPVLFYGINFIFSFILFTILLLTVGGPVFG